jgi:clan AA aspartic protease (TIGR02281 family)
MSRSLRAAAFTTILLAAAIAVRAEDTIDVPVDIFATNHLTKFGNLYVLPAEKDLADGMKALRQLKVKVQTDEQARGALENKLKMVKSVLSQMDLQRRKLYEEYTALTDVGAKNQRVAQANVLESKIEEGKKFKDDLEKQINAISQDNKTQYVETVIDLGIKADQATDTYKQLAANDDLKAAIAKGNEKATLKMRLGPSGDFLTNSAGLKRWRAEVSSLVIPVKMENNVATVEVTINGKVTRSMVVDTGASTVTVTADLAKQLGLVPGDADPPIQLTLADGKIVEGRLMKLKTVRVGQYTVEEVECAVLPETLVAAEPLLGGSFLGNFIVRLDPKAGELHLSVLKNSQNKVLTATGASAPKVGSAPTQ